MYVEELTSWNISVKRRIQTTTLKRHRPKGDKVRRIFFSDSSLPVALPNNSAPLHRGICQNLTLQ